MLELGPTLSLAVAPLTPTGGGGVKRAVEAAARLGYRAVQLSAAQRGIRPRELDRRARRDLGATLGRAGVALAGLDLMVPGAHWTDAAHVDRAIAAATAALELAADLGRVPVSIPLPHAALAPETVDALATAADARAVPLAVHGDADPEALMRWLDELDQPMIGAAVDPAAVIAADHDLGPVDAALACAARLLVARVDDFDATGAARCPVGAPAGSLRLMNYRAALSTCDRLRSIVVDPRGLHDPAAAAAHARAAWDRAAGVFG